MVLFAFALDNDGILQRVAPGLVWLATLFSSIVVVQRTFAVESADNALDALRVAGLPPAGIFLGSTAEGTVRAHALAGTLDDYELSFEDGEKLRGRFLVQRLDYAGDFNGERSYTLQLESSGPVVAA